MEENEPYFSAYYTFYFKKDENLTWIWAVIKEGIVND